MKPITIHKNQPYDRFYQLNEYMRNYMLNFKISALIIRNFYSCYLNRYDIMGGNLLNYVTQ